MIIAQISDTHIGPGDEAADAQDAEAMRLQQAVDHLLRLPARPDLVVITGDCVNGGSLPEQIAETAVLLTTASFDHHAAGAPWSFW